MRCLKPLFVTVLLGSFFHVAAAQEAQEQDKQPAQEQGKQQEQARKPDPKEAARKEPSRRRSVWQVIDGMPAQPPAGTEVYRPTLQPPPRAPVAATQPAATVPAAVPPSPVQINSCDAGGCTDTSGTRYTGGVGNTVLDPQGRNCTRTGTTVQCF